MSYHVVAVVIFVTFILQKKTNFNGDLDYLQNLMGLEVTVLLLQRQTPNSSPSGLSDYWHESCFPTQILICSLHQQLLSAERNSTDSLPTFKPGCNSDTRKTHTHTHWKCSAGQAQPTPLQLFRKTPPIKGSTDGSKSITKNTWQSFGITTHSKWTLCMPQIWNYTVKGCPLGAPTPDPLSRHVCGGRGSSSGATK